MITGADAEGGRDKGKLGKLLLSAIGADKDPPMVDDWRILRGEAIISFRFRELSLLFRALSAIERSLFPVGV